jgi:hypothetical protein
MLRAHSIFVDRVEASRGVLSIGGGIVLLRRRRGGGRCAASSAPAPR